MGEYATRKSDGKQIKIGTCNAMYYLRPDQIEEVICDYNLKQGGISFRLPFPDEKDVMPGDFREFKRSVRLHREGRDFRIQNDGKPLSPGRIQLWHESGLIMSVDCFHGEKLPEDAPGVSFGWNGKTHSAVLTRVKSVLVASEEGERLRFFPLVGCRHCGCEWVCEWDEVWDFIPDELQEELQAFRV